MKKWAIALIGCGMISKSHIDAIAELPNAEIVAVCDIAPEKARAAGEKAGCAWYKDPIEMLESAPQIEVCLIATPTYTHKDLIELCARRKKAIICEKPIAMRANDAKRIDEIIREEGVKYMTAQVVRFWTGYVTLKKMVDEGEFGDIYMSYFSRLSEQQRWDNDWLYDPANGGGAMYDMLVHDVDFMNYLFGRAKSVYALASKDETNCYQNVFASIEYQSGARGAAETSFTMRSGYPFSMFARIIGSKATAEFTYKAGYSINDRDSAICELNIWRDGQPVEVLKPKQYDAYNREIAYFLECLERDLPIGVITIPQSVEVIRVINAIDLSASQGRVVSLSQIGRAD